MKENNKLTASERKILQDDLMRMFESLNVLHQKETLTGRYLHGDKLKELETEIQKFQSTAIDILEEIGNPHVRLIDNVLYYHAETTDAHNIRLFRNGDCMVMPMTEKSRTYSLAKVFKENGQVIKPHAPDDDTIRKLPGVIGRVSIFTPMYGAGTKGFEPSG